jgi:protein TonB
VRTSVVYGIAIAAHAAFFGVVVALPKPVHRERVAVVIREVKKAKPKPEPKPAAVEAPKPKPATPRKVATATPKPSLAPPPPPSPSTAPKAAAPVADFGLTLASGDGPAIAAPKPVAAPRPQPAPEKRAPRPKVLAAAGAPEEEGCPDPAVKPKPVNIVQPAYTDDARGAQIEGKVRVEITVGADGTVTDVRVLAGLGHGLDEAALAAAKASTFEPGTSCGKPITMTFTIGMRFSL